MSDEENPRTRNPDSEKTCDTCLWTNSSKESRNRRVGQAKAIISHKRSLCIECWVMRWSRERSLEPHPCLYLPRPTYPWTQRINGRTTATRIARTSNEEQDYNIITLRGFRERERERDKLLYLWKCTPGVRRWNRGCVYGGGTPRAPTTFHQRVRFKREWREKEKERKRTFVPPDRWSALHHACTASIRSDGCDRASRTKVSRLISFRIWCP